MARSIQLMALRDRLQAEPVQAVFIGRAENNVTGLSLWPWKLEVQANLRAMPPPFLSQPSRDHHVGPRID